MSTAGESDWEYPATMPQHCLLPANGNVLFSQSTGAVEGKRDKRVLWEFADHARLKRGVRFVQVWSGPEGAVNNWDNHGDIPKQLPPMAPSPNSPPAPVVRRFPYFAAAVCVL